MTCRQQAQKEKHMFRVQHRCLAWMLPVLLAGPATTRAAETLDDVGRHLDDLVRQYRTIRYRIEATTSMPAGGQTVRRLQVIDHEVLRLPDGRTLTRYQTRTTSRRYVSGKGEQVEETSTLAIYDGRYFCELRQTPQRITAAKKRLDRSPHDPVGRLAQARQGFEARLLPERTFEGSEVYAIEFLPRTGDPATMNQRMVSYTDRRTGLPIKTITYDEDGRAASVAAVVESKLNEDIPEDHFVFHAPPGVEVVDLTPPENQGAATGRRSSAVSSQQSAVNSQPAASTPVK